MRPAELAEVGHARAHGGGHGEAVDDGAHDERVRVRVEAHVHAVDALQREGDVAHERPLHPRGEGGAGGGEGVSGGGGQRARRCCCECQRASGGVGEVGRDGGRARDTMESEEELEERGSVSERSHPAAGSACRCESAPQGLEPRGSVGEVREDRLDLERHGVDGWRPAGGGRHAESICRSLNKR